MLNFDRKKYYNKSVLTEIPEVDADDLRQILCEADLVQVFKVINSGYRNRPPMIVTTNLMVDELENPTELLRARIYDRVLEWLIIHEGATASDMEQKSFIVY